MAHVFLAWLRKQESLVDNILELCVHFIGRSKEGIVYIDALRIYSIIFPLVDSLTSTQTPVKRSIIEKYKKYNRQTTSIVYIQSENFFSNLV